MVVTALSKCVTTGGSKPIVSQRDTPAIQPNHLGVDHNHNLLPKPRVWLVSVAWSISQGKRQAGKQDNR